MTKPMIKGIDVSRWNGDVDYRRVKSAGVDCVIIQCGYGSEDNQKDPYFEKNYKSARANGMKIGVYHYSYASSAAQAKKEAKLCLKWIKNKSLDMPVYIDMEEERLTGLGRSALTKIAHTFCSVIEEAGYKAGVYANANWYRNYLNYGKLRKKYSIWLAQYSSKRDFDCDIWQYADNGRITGNAGNFDMNYIYNLPMPEVKFKKRAGLYKYPYKDTAGKTSVKVKTAKKGSVAEWIYDDGYGWSKVRVDGAVYYAVNSRMNRKNLSRYPLVTLKKDTTAYKVVNNKITKAKTIKKGKKVKVICTIEKGSYRNFKLISRAGAEYYIKY